jgi:hypothetical protein
MRNGLSCAIVRLHDAKRIEIASLDWRIGSLFRSLLRKIWALRKHWMRKRCKRFPFLVLWLQTRLIGRFAFRKVKVVKDV